MIAPEKIWITPESCESRLDWNGCLSFNTDNDGGTEYTRTDLSQAAVAAALEAAAEIARSGQPDWDEDQIPDKISALITPAQHDALAAHVAAEVAKARAEDTALRDAAKPLLNMAMWTESAEDTEVVIVTVGTVRAIRNALAQIGAKP